MRNKPCVILSKPSLSQNIGSVARAMLNFGLTEMRVISPQAKIISGESFALAAGATNVLENAKMYENISDCIKDLQYIYAATARPRDMIKEVLSPNTASLEINNILSKESKVGLLFGAERSGLDNDEISRCDKIITIPLNLDFSSINLAQSVILVVYEIFQNSSTCHPANPLWDKYDNSPATKKEIHRLLDQLEQELDIKNYFRADHKKKVMMRNLTNFFSKSNATSQEIQTLRGVISYLVK